MDFLAVGDTAIDDFIRLKDASVHCDLDNENCTISMRWGDKIPFESSTVVYGVGNAANAAVAAARLGLSAGFVSDVGNDERGKKVIEHFNSEKVDSEHVHMHVGKPTNYHYVLSYESERTILIKHEAYPRRFPNDLPPPKTLYLSSLGEGTDQYHDDIADYLEAHSEIFFAFQPGTFQIALGTSRLARLYARANLFVVNKDEAGRILGKPHVENVRELGSMLKALGPKTVIITDGRNGAYAFAGNAAHFVPLYPDTRAPKERTGAGDAFASTIASALTLGLPLSEALLWGPVNSMSVVQEVGAQKGLLPRAIIEEYLRNAPETYKASPLS